MQIRGALGFEALKALVAVGLAARGKEAGVRP